MFGDLHNHISKPEFTIIDNKKDGTCRFYRDPWQKVDYVCGKTPRSLIF